MTGTACLPCQSTQSLIQRSIKVVILILRLNFHILKVVTNKTATCTLHLTIYTRIALGNYNKNKREMQIPH